VSTLVERIIPSVQGSKGDIKHCSLDLISSWPLSTKFRIKYKIDRLTYTEAVVKVVGELHAGRLSYWANKTAFCLPGALSDDGPVSQLEVLMDVVIPTAFEGQGLADLPVQDLLHSDSVKATPIEEKGE
jgi:hypothetical protein